MNRPGDYSTTPDDLAQKALDEAAIAQTPAGKPAEPEKEAAPELSPAEAWQKALESWKLTEADADAILSAMIEPGYWQRDYKLFNGRVRLRLRTRDMYHQQRVALALAAMPNLSEQEKEFVKFRYDLAGSVVSLNGKAFAHPATDALDADIDAAFVTRLSQINRIPDPLWHPLYLAVSHFNGVVAVALSNGATSGF